MQSLNAKELELRDRARRVLPVLRRRLSRVWDLVAAFAWYQAQRMSGGRSPLFIPRAWLPPMDLRKRVNGFRDIHSFLAIGRVCADDVIRAVTSAGRDPASFRSVLDFGCGCGRTIMWMPERLPNAKLTGTDCDGEAIAWCRHHLPESMGRFDLNEALPPLEYAGGSFDLVYVVSLFSHFDRASEEAWLGELARVTASGGLVIATVHGEYCWRDQGEELVRQVRETGFGYVFSDPKGSPAFQTSYHSESHVREHFGGHFTVLDYIPRGLNRHQDVVVLEKP